MLCYVLFFFNKFKWKLPDPFVLNLITQLQLSMYIKDLHKVNRKLYNQGSSSLRYLKTWFLLFRAHIFTPTLIRYHMVVIFLIQFVNFLVFSFSFFYLKLSLHPGCVFLHYTQYTFDNEVAFIWNKSKLLMTTTSLQKRAQSIINLDLV